MLKNICCKNIYYISNTVECKYQSDDCAIITGEGKNTRFYYYCQNETNNMLYKLKAAPVITDQFADPRKCQFYENDII